MDEIRHYTADLSLQELETEQFYDFFLPELKREGYKREFFHQNQEQKLCLKTIENMSMAVLYFFAQTSKTIITICILT